jgi:hypothetical protein
LVYHNAVVKWSGHLLPLSFDQQKQTWLDSLRFPDGATLTELALGNGRVFWAAYPLELADGTEPAVTFATN